MSVPLPYKLFLTFALICNSLVWIYARPLQPDWNNIPPPPSEFALNLTGLGDKGLSYRLIGLMLQNMGKTNGITTPLPEYNYDHLVEWFFRSYNLEPRSGYIPVLATYYYGATTDKNQVRKLITFLKVAGDNPEGERWRWLVHAIFMARHKLEDLDLAYDIAHQLKKLNNSDKPAWTNMMSAFIKNAKNEKEDAYNLLTTMLSSSAAELDPTEVNHIIGYICEQILESDEASKDPICDLNKP